MIISFFLWLVGMLVLKNYGWEFKEGLGYAMAISAIGEFFLYSMIFISIFGVTV